ncbi:MAG: alpha/beta fold hydrolase [Cognatishimia sp.]
MTYSTQLYAIAGAMLLSAPFQSSSAWADADSLNNTTYHAVEIDDVSIFYREAGPKDAPTLLLLHGFPSSSHMFRDLIPALAQSYHVIAPDYPGFGQSSAPDAADYDYDFTTLAQTMDAFTQNIGLTNYTLYMQDFGGPVGLRLAVEHPERIEGLIFQNATIHAEGWNPDIVGQFAPFWAERSAETEQTLRGFFKAETTQWQYVEGASRREHLSPDAWIHDQAGLDRPGNTEVQLEYLWNYQDNVARYPAWQEYLAQAQPDTLVVWGENDPFFTLAGVSALQAVLPDADVNLFDAGHFALETHAAEIGNEILKFMAR